MGDARFSVKHTNTTRFGPAKDRTGRVKGAKLIGARLAGEDERHSSPSGKVIEYFAVWEHEPTRLLEPTANAVAGATGELITAALSAMYPSDLPGRSRVVQGSGVEADTWCVYPIPVVDIPTAEALSDAADELRAYGKPVIVTGPGLRAYSCGVAAIRDLARPLGFVVGVFGIHTTLRYSPIASARRPIYDKRRAQRATYRKRMDGKFPRQVLQTLINMLKPDNWPAAHPHYGVLVCGYHDWYSSCGKYVVRSSLKVADLAGMLAFNRKLWREPWWRDSNAYDKGAIKEAADYVHGVEATSDDPAALRVCRWIRAEMKAAGTKFPRKPRMPLPLKRKKKQSKRRGGKRPTRSGVKT